MNSPETYYTTLSSPLGLLLLTASPRGLSGLWIIGEKHCPMIHENWQENASKFVAASHQLASYFSGTSCNFNLLLDAHGTVFQQQAWAALQQIPYGQTRTYQQQAIAISRPSAMRAVGTANGKNPLSIIIPCHRVIGSNGTLTGYGGGLSAKRWLLTHEANQGPRLLNLEKTS